MYYECVCKFVCSPPQSRYWSIWALTPEKHKSIRHSSLQFLGHSLVANGLLYNQLCSISCHHSPASHCCASLQGVNLKQMVIEVVFHLTDKEGYSKTKSVVFGCTWLQWAYPLVCIFLAIKEGRMNIYSRNIIKLCINLSTYSSEISLSSLAGHSLAFHSYKAFYPFQPELKSYYTSMWKPKASTERNIPFSLQTIRYCPLPGFKIQTMNASY